MAGTPAFILSAGAAVVGLGFAIYLARWVVAQDAGSELIQKIGRLIQQGAMAFLRREYMILAAFVAIVAVLIAVTFAASASFLTPVGYQTNTMVYGPGGYRFGDYARLGLPLTLLVIAALVVVVPVVWPA